MRVGVRGYPASSKSQDKVGICPFNHVDLNVNRIPQNLSDRIVGRSIKGGVGLLLCPKKKMVVDTFPAKWD